METRRLWFGDLVNIHRTRELIPDERPSSICWYGDGGLILRSEEREACHSSTDARRVKNPTKGSGDATGWRARVNPPQESSSDGGHRFAMRAMSAPKSFAASVILR
jgi:hypothetical protein